MLRQHFLRPSLNLDIINERLDTVGVFSHPECDSTTAGLVKILKSVGNMRVMMISLRKGLDGTTKGKGGLSRSVWSAIRGVVFPFSFQTV